MRRLWLICLLLLLALGLVAGPAVAAPVSDLTALAASFPESTVFFAAMRTDDGFIETLDGVVGQVRELLPSAMLPPLRLNSLLDQAVGELGLGSFREAVRPWLGSTAALGVSGETFAGMPGFLLAVSITDQTAAAAFVENFLNQMNSEYDTGEQGGYLLFSDPRGQGAFAVGKDVLFLTLSTSDVPGLRDDFTPLAASTDFSGVMAQLPAASYNLVAYLNVPALAALSERALPTGSPETEAMQQLGERFLDAVGPAALGFTILDGRSLVMDVVQTLGSAAALEAADFDLTLPTAAVDPAFAAYIPADAPLVIQGTELNTSVTTGFHNLRVMGSLIQQQLRSLPADQLDEDVRWMRAVNPGVLLERFITLGFTGLTGLDLQQDVLPWMDGDYAAYLRLLPLPEDSASEAAPDFALLVEASDTAGPAALIDGMAAALEDYGVTFFERQEIAGPALVLTGLIPAMSPRHEAALQAIRELDLIVGSGDGLLVAGTRAAATYSLAPQGETLADSPAYTEALGYALDGAQQFWFMNTRAFVPVIDTMIARETGRSQQDMREARILAGLLSSGSISAVASPDGSAVARFVLTLAADPLEQPEA